MLFLLDSIVKEIHTLIQIKVKDKIFIVIIQEVLGIQVFFNFSESEIVCFLTSYFQIP